MFPLVEAVGLVAFGAVCFALGYALGMKEEQ
jgi:hypothetical protein